MRRDLTSMTELPLEADERLVQIYNRALAARIPCAWYARGTRAPMLKLRLPDGAAGVIVDVRPEEASRFAQAPFENIVLLGKYLAHWDTERREIYAGVKKSIFSSQLSSIPGFEAAPKESEAPAKTGDDLLGKLSEPGDVSEVRNLFSQRGAGQLVLGSPSRNITITLRTPPSNELFFCSEVGTATASLRIEGVEVGNVEEATRFLFDVTHALFFELDVNYSITLHLCFRVDYSPFTVERPGVIPSEPPPFPEVRYPRDAIALYMHARSIRAAPLTEYLTYYQVIEHCMAAFSRPNIIRRLRERLVDPSFDMDDDVALSELLQPGRGSQSNMTEREQFRLAVSACVTPEKIKEILRSDESLASELRLRTGRFFE